MRPRLVRRTGDAVVLGVGAGLADHFGVDRRWVRLGLVGATLLGGVGVVVYVAAALLMPGDDGTPALASRWRPRDALDGVAVAAIVVGGVLLTRQLVPSGPALLVVPVVVAAVTLAVLVSWPHADPSRGRPELPSWVPPSLGEAVGVLSTRRGLVARAVLGGAITLTGAIVLLGGTSSWTQLRNGLLALALVVAGIALVFGPWLARLGGELVGERRERIRNQERAEMAAHLHDSVLQTLALVQRRADDPTEVVRLARKQERELRTWLLTGQTDRATAATFGALIDAHAAELEDANGVAVEVVHVRDCPVDDALNALALATREAIVNAQRHAHVASVAVFTEVEPDIARVYVRDRGVGFDRASVPEDRRGLSESIEGRVRRHGGTATIRTTPGEGTEVALTMPRRPEAP
jgi:signal transduction histidine kinase